MRSKRLMAAGLALACGTFGLTISNAPTASAETAFGCGYPRVCFYKTQADWNARRYTAAYRDMTESYQNLSSAAAGAYAVFNSRNDDGARLHFTNGPAECLKPNTLMLTNGFVVDKIRIMDSPSCSY
ncbi:hypothetical protein ACIHCM_29305 [Streptomyces sp. NPDC052023]|uniref:hypothetical protein n=1 Tax=Streptomyces sp. NPDC052023 TaxID=3365681 RepID=UPI0037CE1116